MQNSVRYYIVKADDQPVVRGILVSRPQMSATPSEASARPGVEAPVRKPSVSSLLRLALRRRNGSDERA